MNKPQSSNSIDDKLVQRGLTKIRADSRNNAPTCYSTSCSTVSRAAEQVPLPEEEKEEEKVVPTITSNNGDCAAAATGAQALPVVQTLSLAHACTQVGGDKSDIYSISTPVASTLVDEEEEEKEEEEEDQIRKHDHLAKPCSVLLSQRHRSNSPPPQLADLNLSRNEAHCGLAQWPSLEARLSRLVRAHINSKSRRTVDVHTLLLWARDLYVQLYGQPGSHRGRKRQPSPDCDSYHRCYNYNVYNYYGSTNNEASGHDVKRMIPPAALGSLRKSSTIPRTLVYLSDSALSVPYVRRASAPVGSEAGPRGGVDDHSEDNDGTKNENLRYDNDEDLNAYHNNNDLSSHHPHQHKIEASRYKGYVFFDIVEEEEDDDDDDDEDDETELFECDDLERVPSITEAMIMEFAAANRIILS
ncbi:uncharacterized protein SAPINGB_P002050 [Magnusiomyces paraingens]|uniref:Uncharacterized protein n=1 Tax=Magnusiomyces paraingens TaxID=2606893 RepID=A0A5E8BJX1_9ASCO|nr:uncharacterized protein SAPINGB_P002050 [Saprochaete ingens]VVT48991.1 unnamed protein product [Saprochaete ingens]